MTQKSLLYMIHPCRLYSWVAVIGSCLLLLICISSAQASSNPFPMYKSIEPNVAFWKKVYAEYPSDTGLVHDSDNLSVIYEVMKVKRYDEPGSRRYNKKKIRAAKKKYKRILQNLAAKKRPTTAEEKRVAALFGRKGSAKIWGEAANSIRFQLCLSDRFKAGVTRSGRYLSQIKTIFRKNRLPVDLAYLPHVESSFNYKAYSKFGAAGIWQFIRSTGRRFLKVSYTLDERRDPIVASHAAAKYLKENYQKLNDWPLAITAYNHGAGSMERAQRKHGDYETIFNKYDHRRFGFASKNFYSEFLAAVEIAKNYRSYFQDISLDRTVRTQKITMNGYAPVPQLIKHFDIDIETFKELNPALRKPVYSGQKYIPKGYSVKLPFHLKDFKKLAQNIPANIYKKEQKRSRFYRVERGDTAGKIARMHKVKLRDLIDINMLNRRATIYVGQNLRIPAPGEKIKIAKANSQKKSPALSTGKKASADSTVLATTATITDTSKKPVAKASPKAPETRLAQLETGTTIPAAPLPPVPPTPPEKSSVSPPEPLVTKGPSEVPAFTTAMGEKIVTLAQIPLPQKSSAKDTFEKAPPGIKLHYAKPVQADQASVPAEITSYEPPPHLAEETPAIEPPAASITEVNPEVISGNFKIEKVIERKGRQVGFVQVEDMETLGHYADWLGIPTQRIRTLNGFSFGQQIQAHQQIKIPLGTVGKDLFEERRYEYHKEVEEDFFSAYKVVGIQSYSIKRGDNIWTLCRDEFELPFWLIQKYNPVIDFDSLRPQQRLTIPVTEPVAPVSEPIVEQTS